MFDKNFNAEASLKNWAVIIRVAALGLMGLSFLAAVILLCVDAEWLWWISLTVLGSGGVVLLSAALSSVLIWGFGDLIGNTKRMACGTSFPTAHNDDELPEL